MNLISGMTGARILAVVITAIDIVAAFVVKGPNWIDFLLGFGAGIGIALVVLLWTGDFTEPDKA